MCEICEMCEKFTEIYHKIFHKIFRKTNRISQNTSHNISGMNTIQNSFIQNNAKYFIKIFYVNILQKIY